jgi:Tol biopolymer transport system component
MSFSALHGARPGGVSVALGLMIAPAVLAQTSSRIAFSSDQPASTDLDIWVTPEDGDPQIRFTTELTNAHAPSICNDGRRIFYAAGGVPGLGGAEGGNLYVKDITTGTVQLVRNCVGENPQEPVEVCLDVDCGPPAPGSNNPRIV